MNNAAFKYSGQNQDVANLLQNIECLIVSDYKTNMTLATAKTLAGWGAIINPATTAAITGTVFNVKRGFENKTVAPQMTKSNLLQYDKTEEEAPQGMFHLVQTFEDYNLLWPADGSKFSITLLLRDGTKLMTKLSTGNLQGFTGRVWLENQLPLVGADKQKQYALNVIFEEIDEWKNNMVLVPATDHSLRDIKDLVPVGLNVEIVTAYATGGDVTVKVTKRGSNDPYAGLTTAAEWEVVGVPDTDLGVTIAVKTSTNAAQGQYTLTVKNGTPADLAGGAYIRALKITASHVVYLSNPILIKL